MSEERYPLKCAVVAGHAPSSLLSSTFEYQETNTWCGAAAAATVASYLSCTEETWTQCKIASRVVRKPESQCCNTNGAANVGRCRKSAVNLSRALRVVRCNGGKQGFYGGFASIESSIAENRPVCFHIEWKGSDRSHYIVAMGGRSHLLLFADSFYGLSASFVDLFPTYYQGGCRIASRYNTMCRTPNAGVS